MVKSTIDTFQQTIDNRISVVTTTEELTDLTSELREWIDWLKKDKKISQKEYLHLNNLVLEKSNSMKSKLEFSKQKSVPKNGKNKIVLSAAVLFIAVILLLGSLYYIYLPTKQNESNNTAGTIPFRGTLKNAESTPIDTKTDVIFRLYGGQNDGVPLYEGKCIGTDGIVPDYRGEFTVVLGSDCSMSPIPEAVLNKDILFLGVTIASGEEITPRYRIVSSTYSHNSAQVAGKSLGTGINSIPFLNENAQMLFEASDPSIISTNGDFKIEGASLSLKTSSGGGGDIILQPDAGAYTLVPSGSVGIGLFEPTSKLEVVGLEPYNPITNIKNISIEDSENTNVLSLGLGTSREGENAKFMSFRADVTKEQEGTEVGAIRLNNEGVSYETEGADFAEYFTMNTVTKYQPGTIISLSESGTHIAHRKEVLVGVVSDTAGFVGNAKHDNKSQLVGLVGQVDVLVTNETGLIAQGDGIGIGTIPGYGVLSYESPRVGYALEDSDVRSMQSDLCPKEFQNDTDIFGNPIKCGKVKILLRPH